MIKESVKCQCGTTIERRIFSDGWYIQEHIGKDGCGHWEGGFENAIKK